jgi:hypothetical protein
VSDGERSFCDFSRRFDEKSPQQGGLNLPEQESFSLANDKNKKPGWLTGLLIFQVRQAFCLPKSIWFRYPAWR